MDYVRLSGTPLEQSRQNIDSVASSSGQSTAWGCLKPLRMDLRATHALRSPISMECIAGGTRPESRP
jgi:hypothetical protein